MAITKYFVMLTHEAAGVPLEEGIYPLVVHAVVTTQAKADKPKHVHPSLFTGLIPAEDLLQAFSVALKYKLIGVTPDYKYYPVK
jgi:hypothetical protein